MEMAGKKYDGPTYTEMMAEAREFSNAMRALAIEAGKLAGLGSDGMCFLLGHNALVGRHYGKPWKDVDYGYVELMKALQEAQFIYHHVVDFICKTLDDLYGPIWIREGMD
jgi:hypothetical protein